MAALVGIKTGGPLGLDCGSAVPIFYHYLGVFENWL